METSAGYVDFTVADQMVSVATQAGVPLLGLIAYSTRWASSVPRDFDVTEVAPFKVAWHTGTSSGSFGYIGWGSDNPRLGAAKYLWKAPLEDGSIAPRVAYLRPALGGYVHGALTIAIPQAKSVTLESKIGLLHESPLGSRFNFSITYASGNKFPALLNVQKSRDGSIRADTADMTALAGKTVTLFWNVDTINGYAPGDPILQEAKILVNGAPYSMVQFLGDDLPSIVSYPPADPAVFAKFAGKLAARYPQIQAWEVWNEPNLSYYWRPAPNPSAYLELLRESYRAIKQSNPRATVVMGGLSSVTGTGYLDSMMPDQFLNQIYTAPDRPFDVLGLHPYGAGIPRGDIDKCLQSVVGAMRAQGDPDRRIWITEVGWPTQGPGSVAEATQAANMCQASEAIERFPSVARVYWYSLQDGTGSPLFPVQYYGLFHQDGSPKPAAAMFVGAERVR